jgi:nicotinate-nucleotide pyrophosphorylase (carboxylating)
VKEPYLEKAWESEVVPLVRLALAEDVGGGDVTTEILVPEGHRSRATILAKEELVLSGLAVAEEVFRQVDAGLSFRARARGGDRLRPGDPIAEILGRTRSILTAERTALNFLQRLSGIATHTARYAERIVGCGVVLLDTRKTVPGLRLLSKQAARDGGALNHRLRLDDTALIKDNHVEVAGGQAALAAAITALRTRRPGLPIILEVGSLEELASAARLPIDRVLLDNFSPEEVRVAVDLLRAAADAAEGAAGTAARRIAVEVSGGVTLETIAAYAQEGVDAISVGALTHSAPAVDLALYLQCLTTGLHVADEARH